MLCWLADLVSHCAGKAQDWQVDACEDIIFRSVRQLLLEDEPLALTVAQEFATIEELHVTFVDDFSVSNKGVLSQHRTQVGVRSLIQTCRCMGPFERAWVFPIP